MTALHLRLTLGIAALIGLVAVALLVVVGRTSARYADEVLQRLNADVAMYVAKELPLFEGAAVNPHALEELAHRVMTVNPTAEVYLLDSRGHIAATLVPRERLIAEAVDVRPIETFLAGERGRPIYGPDPTSRGTQRVFSAARLRGPPEQGGYLYIVLGGQPAQSVAQSVRGSYVLRAASFAVLIPLGAVLVLAAGLFWVLTRRVRALDAAMRTWMTTLPIAASDDPPQISHHDEIEALRSRFEWMARTIENQLVQLRASDALRRELVAHVSHDLRTPLSALRGYLETIRMKSDSLPAASQKEYLDVAIRHGEQLSHLVDALFELAKLESGAASLVREPFALAELLHDIAVRYRLPAQKRGVTLRVLSEPSTALALGDVALIERAIANLLDNALRHTPDGGFIRIEMWTEPGQMRVQISDTGSGIAAAELPRLLDEPSVEQHTSARGGGLGLTIVRRIFELHGHSIRILSRPGAGTSVEFALDAAIAVRAEPTGDAVHSTRASSSSRGANEWINDLNSEIQMPVGHAKTLAPWMIFAITIAAPEARAQQAGLAVSVVREGSATPVAGAQVAIENPSIGLVHCVQTDSSGQARLAGLSNSGDYIVRVEAAEDYGEARSAPLSLRSNYVRGVTLVVPASELATVLVEGSRAVATLNHVNAEVSATLGEEELEALPLEGRDVLRALVHLPNVVPSTGFFPEAPAISINGANGLYVNYLIDGLDNNENFLGGPKFPMPLGFARDVTVLANSFSAEFGRSATGVVNVSSRAGGNELESEVYALVRPGQPPDASSAFPQRDLSGNFVGDSFERLQSGVSVGGPIVHDRSFFYANLEYTRDTSETLLDAPAVGAVETLEGHNRFLLASARLDHRFDDAWIGTLRANLGRVTIERPGGSLGGGSVQFPSAGSEQDRDSALVAATLRYAGDAWSYRGSVQWSGFDWDYGEAPQSGPQVAARGPAGTPVAIVGHPGFVFDDRERTIQTQHNAEIALGEHRIAIGADYLAADFELEGGGNSEGNFVVDLTDAQLDSLRSLDLGSQLAAADILALDPTVDSYGVELHPQSFGRTQRLAALYVEDEWHIGPRLTVAAGVRWDYDSLTGEGGGDDDLDNVAPRLSLNFRPDERNVLRAGAGLFYDKLTYAVISDALQRNTTSAAFRSQLSELVAQGVLPADTDLERATFDGNLTVNPVCVTVAACPPAADVQALRDTAVINEARILNPDGYESPYATQLSLGWQRQIHSEWSGAIDLLYNRTRHLVRLRDLNAPASFIPNAAALSDDVIAELRALPDDAARIARAAELGLVRAQADADATRPVALVPGGARQITVSETEGNAEYRALNLQLLKERGDDRWAARLSYTLSKLENDTDDINFRASNANDFARDRGPSANDRRHVISAVAYLHPLPDLTLSIAGLLQSGQPVNLVPDARIFGTQDLNGDGASFGENFVGNSDRYPGVSRNSGRLSWSSTVDLGMRYRLRIADFTVELSADVFNLFDENNESGFANAATTSNQVQFGGGAAFVQRNAGPPRQFQFGIAARL